MASFSVNVYKIKVEPHNDADTLELGVVGDFRAIVRKGQFKDGDLIAYIPEASLVPLEIVKEMGLEGKLSGPSKNRVKAIKLRGVVSQGLVYPAREGWFEGQDVTELLGVTKYDPPIPAQFAGEQGSSAAKLNYDIENFKKYPGVIGDDEEVVMTEKIHGTFFTIGLSTEANVVNTEGLHMGHFIISSKGLIKRGVFIRDNEKNENNTYIRAAKKFELGPKLLDIIEFLTRKGLITLEQQMSGHIWLMGEVFGRSVQFSGGVEGYAIPHGDLGFRAFDIRIGHEYLDYDVFKAACDHVGIDTVPLVYRGPFSVSALEQVTSGKETVSGKQLHIREGVVVKPVRERNDYQLGRVCLKSVSDVYLLKSTGEELS